jgi:hypothetical protein
VSLCPVWVGRGSGLREGVAALPASVTSLALSPDLSAEKDGGGAGGAWRLRLSPTLCVEERRSVPAVLELCAAFDRPGLPCSLAGTVELLLYPPAEAGPGALNAYVGQCAELAGRLCSGGTPSGVELSLEEGGSEGGGLFDRVLGAVLPAAAPHVSSLRLLVPGSLPSGFSRHLTAPGLAFPLLCSLELGVSGRTETPMDAADVAALARLVAPRLCRVGLLCPAPTPEEEEEEPDEGFTCWGFGGTLLGGSTAAVTALAMGLVRPVDAAGRPAGLELSMGVNATEEGDEEKLERALVAAGRGWARVTWPPDLAADEYEDHGVDNSDDYGGFRGAIFHSEL